MNQPLNSPHWPHCSPWHLSDVSPTTPLTLGDALIYGLAPDTQLDSQFQMTPQEQSRYTRLSHPHIAEDFRRSRYLMHLLNIYPSPQPNGYLYNNPAICLTHKKKWVLCGQSSLQDHHAKINHSCTLGIDLETTQLSIKLSNWLLKRYAPDLTAPAHLPLHYQAALIFSAREALYKAWSRYRIEKLVYVYLAHSLSTPTSDYGTYTTSFKFCTHPASTSHLYSLQNHLPPISHTLLTEIQPKVQQLTMQFKEQIYVLSIYHDHTTATALTPMVRNLQQPHAETPHNKNLKMNQPTTRQLP